MTTKIYKSLLFFFLSFLFSWMTQLAAEGFLAGTLIKTISGHVPIEQLIVGDIIVSYDDKNNCYTQYPITCVDCFTADSYIKIQINNKYIYASPEQKFYVHNKRKWLTVHALKPTDTLMTFDGCEITINAIEVVNQLCTLHSLSVDTNHTFCISHNNIVVHNFIPAVAQITLNFGSAIAPIVQSILPVIQTTGALVGATILSKLAQKISHKHRHTMNNTQPISVNSNHGGNDWKDPDDNDDENDQQKHPNGTYKDAPYHHRYGSGKKSPSPKNGQKCLDNSFKSKSNSEQRISIEDEVFVVLRKTRDREYHGYCVIWEDLHWSLQQILRDLKVVTKSGKIITEVAAKVFK